MTGSVKAGADKVIEAGIGDGLKSATQRKASIGQTLKAVAWSFFGVRRRDHFEQDVERLNPVHLILAGIALALLFIFALVLLVRWVVGSGVAT